MSAEERIGKWLRTSLPDLLAEYGVPGAAVAVGHGDETVDAVAGLLSTATGVETTVDSIFQIGSITKLFTATLVQQLVDEGRVELDAPVRTWLPEFQTADPSAAEQITVRQLMCHVSGFEGDIFTDTGKGDDCVEKFVALLADVPQLFPPGEMWSYNNAAFCLLGRLVEVLCGKPYDACLREHLLAPLGLTHVATDPYEAVLHRVAVGHVEVAGGHGLEPTHTWALPRSNGPAGAMLAMQARDLITFARHHLATPALAGMRQPQVALPDLGQGEAWGLGWELFQLEPTPIIGHDGNTIGQSAFLRILPEHDLVVALLTNGGPAKPVHRAVTDHVFRELAGVELPPLPTAPAELTPPDPTRYVGTYASDVGRTIISQDDDGRLWLDRTPLGVLAEIDEPAYRTELVAWRGDSLWPVEPEGGVHQPVAFVGDDGTGRAAYLHTGRADRRVG